MKSLIVSVAALFALAVSVPAQCFGVYPTGTVDSGIPFSSCSSIPGSTTGPFVTPSGPLVATIGTIRIYWSNLPPITVAPLAFVAFDAAPLNTPVMLPGGCYGYVGDGMLNLGMPLLQAGVPCQTGAILSFPPNPALAGVSFFGQGYMFDPTSGQWATSNSFLTTIQ